MQHRSGCCEDIPRLTGGQPILNVNGSIPWAGGTGQNKMIERRELAQN